MPGDDSKRARASLADTRSSYVATSAHALPQELRQPEPSASATNTPNALQGGAGVGGGAGKGDTVTISVTFPKSALFWMGVGMGTLVGALVLLRSLDFNPRHMSRSS